MQVDQKEVENDYFCQGSAGCSDRMALEMVHNVALDVGVEATRFNDAIGAILAAYVRSTWFDVWIQFSRVG